MAWQFDIYILLLTLLVSSTIAHAAAAGAAAGSPLMAVLEQLTIENLQKYQLEVSGLFFVALFALNYFLGARFNKHIAHYWFRLVTEDPGPAGYLHCTSCTARCGRCLAVHALAQQGCPALGQFARANVVCVQGGQQRIWGANVCV